VGGVLWSAVRCLQLILIPRAVFSHLCITREEEEEEEEEKVPVLHASHCLELKQPFKQCSRPALSSHSSSLPLFPERVFRRVRGLQFECRSECFRPLLLCANVAPTTCTCIRNTSLGVFLGRCISTS
jgi:hypothetical protein